MERGNQDGYITHRPKHEKIIMHQPTWSYASSITLHFGVGDINMERATQDGYITHRSKHKKIIMHQSSWSYASNITQSCWRWNYQYGKSYTRWLHHTLINTRKDYHASTFLIIRVKHNPTISALNLSTWKELHKMVISHTDQYTKRLSCTNVLDHTRQAYPNHLGVGVINTERATQVVTLHTDQYTKRLSCTNVLDHTRQAYPKHLGVGVINMERATQDGYITHRSIHGKIIMHQPSWSYASSIAQQSWLWSYEHGKSYTRWLHHTPINTRKYYHVSTFMIIRIKHNPNILALELSTRKELRKMVTSPIDQYTKRLSCINLHDYTHQV